jgi:enamine deaminase RidA (YjgF/YER057c/UK114 family)
VLVSINRIGGQIRVRRTHRLSRDDDRAGNSFGLSEKRQCDRPRVLADEHSVDRPWRSRQVPAKLIPNPTRGPDMADIAENLHSAGITLPDVVPPVVGGYTPAFAPFIRAGSQIHISGRLAKRGDEIFAGKLGAGISLEEGRAAARDVAIELLSVLNQAAGGLDRVSRIVKILVFVNGAPGFIDPQLLVEILGEPGRHARSAVVAADLPFGACLEIEMIAEIADA